MIGPNPFACTLVKLNCITKTYDLLLSVYWLIVNGLKWANLEYVEPLWLSWWMLKLYHSLLTEIHEGDIFPSFRWLDWSTCNNDHCGTPFRNPNSSCHPLQKKGARAIILSQRMESQKPASKHSAGLIINWSHGCHHFSICPLVLMQFARSTIETVKGFPCS